MLLFSVLLLQRPVELDRLNGLALERRSVDLKEEEKGSSNSKIKFGCVGWS